MSHQGAQTILQNSIFCQIFSQKFQSKFEILRHNWKKFESGKFIFDFKQINKEQILSNHKNDVNFSMNEYLSKIDSLLDTYSPLKKLKKYKICKILLKRKTTSTV